MGGVSSRGRPPGFAAIAAAGPVCERIPERAAAPTAVGHGPGHSGRTSGCSAGCSGTRCASRKPGVLTRRGNQQSALRFRREGDLGAKAALGKAARRAVTKRNAVVRASASSRSSPISRDVPTSPRRAHKMPLAAPAGQHGVCARPRPKRRRGRDALAAFFAKALVSPVLTAPDRGPRKA